MNDELPPSLPPAAPAEPMRVPVVQVPLRRSRRASWLRWTAIGLGLLALVAVVALGMAISTHQRLKLVERELVKRQDDSQGEAAAARMESRQAQDSARESAAKVALLDARVSEAALQRTQLEDLIQSLSRSRDENVVADVESAIRVAVQQSAITGSAEPLIATLKQSDDRLARYNQPRLERVRRAIARDLDRTKSAGATDISALTLKLDEAVRQVDDLPLLSAAEPRKSPVPPGDKELTRPAARHAAATAAAGSAPAPHPGGNVWVQWLSDGLDNATTQIWNQARSLVRVTRVDDPEAALVAPDQAFFLRENLKLRLLNARLAILSRQFDTAQADLASAQTTLDRYFDHSSKRVQAATDLLAQVAAQAKVVNLPKPDDTMAALIAVSGN